MRGRPHKPYRTSKGKYIDGLSRRPDGRWRVQATGKVFTEPDETRAIAKFRKLTTSEQIGFPIREFHPENSNQTMVQYAFADESLAWEWFREQLTMRPAYVAERLGIPSLANLSEVSETLTIAKIEKVYRENAPVTEQSKKAVLVCLRDLVNFANAKTLEDFTTPTLLAYKSEVEKRASLKSAGTRKAIYGRIKTAIAFGKKCGLNAKVIDAALSRMSVLWTAEMTPAPKPNPISREDFTTSLDAAEKTVINWRAFLLLGLNLCMSIDEVCALEWKDFDLSGGTYAALRGKTRRKRIPRVAVLWAETIEALKAFPRRGQSPFVFTSKHGKRYNKCTKVNDFREFADKCDLNHVTFNMIRDGAYTAACKGTTDSRQARVLAGHKADGWEDNYVLRNPELAAKACEAVYGRYLGAPVTAGAIKAA